MKFKVVTLFPENISLSLDYGVIGKAQKEKIIDIEYVNPRNYCQNNNRSVDDKPYGGGPGMVIKAEIQFFNNYKDLLANSTLDILFVSVPNYLAPEVTIAGLEKGLHVFCEKPPL